MVGRVSERCASGAVDGGSLVARVAGLSIGLPAPAFCFGPFSSSAAGPGLGGWPIAEG